uniref:Uncharacterized protein n=1 Tax=viral metagenome TaxID=1070528 RepID=A0A6M3XIK4_9ZZZZ
MYILEMKGETMNNDFDYAVIATCQYDVSKTNMYHDCREPATHKIWWGDSRPTVVCKEHFEFIAREEIDDKTDQG